MVGITGLYLAWVTNEQEKLARITTLRYDLDDRAQKAFTELQHAVEEFSKAVRIWRVTSREATWAWKRNAGASSLITRGRITVGWSRPPFLQSQIKAFSISLGSMQFFFLPDQIFVFQNGKYGAVPYNSLKVSSHSTRYRETEGVPNDLKVLEYTWQYVRKDGGPDRRFSNNQQIPVIEYGQIEFSSQAGMNLHL